MVARGVTRPGSVGYVLHTHDWSESSLILDLFTRDHGRVVAVAKGAKRPYSQLRPVLLPFQLIHVTFGARRSEEADVWLVRQAEWAGGAAWPGGAAMLPGFYVNELLMRLMARHDPHPTLFDAYQQVLQVLPDPALLQAGLRAFELMLLRQLGLLPDLTTESVDGTVLQPELRYELHPELGVVLPQWQGSGVPASAVALSGATLAELDHALARANLGQGMAALMAATLPALAELKAMVRPLLQYHLGSQTLRTRQLMMELQQA